MGWCKLDDTYWSDPKFKRLSKLLGIRKAEARGLVSGLWSWAISNAPDGDLAGYDDEDLEDAMTWEGDKGVLVEAMLSPRVRLLDKDDDGGRSIHGYFKRAGSFRKATQKRKERKRKQPSGDSRATVADTETTALATVAKMSQARGTERTERNREDRDEQSGQIASPVPKTTTAPVVVASDGHVWEYGQPLTRTRDFVDLARHCGCENMGRGLRAATVERIKALLATGPIERWEYDAATESINDSSPNAGLIATVLVRRRTEAKNAATGVPGPQSGNPDAYDPEDPF